MRRATTMILTAGALALGLSMSASASADETKKPITVELKIRARRQIPLVIDIARVEPRLGVADLKGHLVERIERAASKQPF